LTLLGRNKNIFNTLFSTIKEFNTGETPYTNIYQYKDKMWQELTKNYKRKLNTVAIEKDKRDLLVGYIDGFTKDKSWYIENGVPWKTGILLSGPPGTGKTSLIKALCAHYNRPIYIINLAAISDDGLRDALSSVPEGSIVALEDIDAAGIGSPRTSATPSNQNDTKSAQGPSLSMEGSFNILTLSGVLNAIDGVASGEGRILIATTNHPEMLDPALVREGRFDLKVEIGYMNDETYFDYLKRFYPTFNFVGYHVLPNIAPCLVQKLVFENKNNPEKVLKQTSVKKGLSCCNFSFLENGPNETHPNLPN
jgi:chaperone BCS1